MKRMSKKGMGIGDLPNIVLALIMGAAFFVAGFLVIAGLKTGLTANSYALNATNNLETGMYNVTTYATNWGTIIGVAILLGILIGGLYFVGKNKGMV